MLQTRQVAMWVEAERIRPSSLHPHQLARTLHALTTTTDQQIPLLLLVLGAPPPVRFARVGTPDIREAIAHSLTQMGDQREQDLVA